MIKSKFLLGLFAVALTSSSCSAIEISKDHKKIKAPFDGDRFNNIEPFEDKSLWTVLKWRLNRKDPNWKTVKNQKFFKPSEQRVSGPRLTLIGHSTVLIQIDNLNILTDPQYSERASLVSWAGPKRVIQPAIKFEDLPPIDVVLISHNHYDHLDIKTLQRLSHHHSPIILAGLGNKPLLQSNEIQKVYEMDWWDEFSYKNIKIHFTPVQHWSARGAFDKRKTLWGGFYIKASNKIFFAGDTGYGKVFKMIHEKYGKIDIGLIPIGAYEPRSFMKNAHINPEEAVKIFRDLELRHGFGVHFGTFSGLTDEPRLKPIEDLKIALEKENLPESQFIAPDFGKEYNY